MTNALTEDEFDALRIRVRQTVIPLGNRDDRMTGAVDKILRNVRDWRNGASSEKRGYFITGESGSGKSFSIKHHFGTHPRLQPKRNAKGNLTQPFISVVAPPKSPPIKTVAAVLKQMNLPNDGSEEDMTKSMREQFISRETLILHLDEYQHAGRSNAPKTIEGIQDWLKNMLQIEDWPLHIIVSGIPKLEEIRKEEQVERRTRIIRFDALDYPGDCNYVESCLTKVAVDGCGLNLGADIVDPEKNFLDRLCRATNGGFGRMIECTQEASFRAISRGRSTLTLAHFANEYEEDTDCPDAHNMFRSDDYRELVGRYGMTKKETA